MRDKNQIFADIMAKPESDELRREFAAAIDTEDAEWSAYITATSVAVRSGRTAGHHSYPCPRPSAELEKKLWSPFQKFNVTGELERGFPAHIRVHRDIFLEHGDEILSRAPILSVTLLHENGSTHEGWTPYLERLSRSPLLSMIYDLSLGPCSVDAFIELTRSPFLHKLVLCSVEIVQPDAEARERVWNARLESDVLRRMPDWGAFEEERGSMHMKRRVSAPGEYGDVERQEQGYYAPNTFYDPMNEASRALEQKYGYIPALHAGNWGASVVDILQRRKPDFPAGARPIEAMYAVPSPDDHH